MDFEVSVVVVPGRPTAVIAEMGRAEIYGHRDESAPGPEVEALYLVG